MNDLVRRTMILLIGVLMAAVLLSLAAQVMLE